MTPTVAIVGRPNVGKSTLFNRLTHSRNALVAAVPGMTRDRRYGLVQRERGNYVLVDTSGLSVAEGLLEHAMEEQTRFAIREADLVIMLCDARDGITLGDREILEDLRKANKPLLLVINKIDGLETNTVVNDFHILGLGAGFTTAANQGRGVNELLKGIDQNFKAEFTAQQAEKDAIEALPDNVVKVAIVGRPNAGKSTLVNRILGEDRMLASDIPGTTRDSIYVPFQYQSQDYILIDTAGLRRRAKVHETAEKFSMLQTYKAVDDAHVVILLLDAETGIADQDLTILGQVIEAGKALLIATNKWDILDKEDRERHEQELDRRLSFINYAQLHFISAVKGAGVKGLFKSVTSAYAAAQKSLSTPELTRLLQSAIQQHAPPMVHGRRIKMRYAHQGGSNPPLIVIHGNQTESVPDSYQRYLENYFRNALQLSGTPLRLQFKGSSNPFAGRRNTLNPRQVAKRKRLIRHHKKK